MTPEPARRRFALFSRNSLLLTTGVWLCVFFASLFTPPILDDADATHASAARAILATGDWVTLHVDGIRYLEKAPLPYWLAALSFRLFGFNTFALHLPLALEVLALALLGHLWAGRAFGQRAALYTGLFTLTSLGVFLFTRVFLPEVLLSLLLAAALYCRLRSLEENSSPFYAYAVPVAVAGAVLTKGLVTFVFYDGTIILFLILTGLYRNWRRIRPFSATAIFLLLAAPWHILAGLRNRGGDQGHGFFWFYFINEHVLRFLGRRQPMDYNKLPALLYWGLHLIWLFPWSLFAPLAIALLYRTRRTAEPGLFTRRTVLLLLLFSSVVLIFFSLSTNQEYYTFPAYLPLLMILAAALARADQSAHPDARGWLWFAHAAFTVMGLAAAAALLYGLWTSRHLAYVADIGSLAAHRGIGNYTLSLSHFFDLTGPSFAALRRPAAIAALVLAVGPPVAWIYRLRGRPLSSTLTVGITSGLLLVAAHLALSRFRPMLSSADFATRIQQLQRDHRIAPDRQVLLFGDQAYGSSLIFYLNEPVYLVDGRTTSMWFGSTFPDTPHLFLTPDQLLAEWGTGPRKILFVPEERRTDVARLLGNRATVLAQTSQKLLLTDRPLDSP